MNGNNQNALFQQLSFGLRIMVQSSASEHSHFTYFVYNLCLSYCLNLDTLCVAMVTGAGIAEPTCTCCRQGRLFTSQHVWWCCSTSTATASGTTADIPTACAGQYPACPAHSAHHGSLGDVKPASGTGQSPRGAWTIDC